MLYTILKQQIKMYYDLNKHLLEIGASEMIRHNTYQRYMALLELEVLFQQEVE